MVRRFLDEESLATGLPLRALLATALGIHVVVTLLAVNPWHPDEHFQILEFAWARAGLAPLEDLPWEWDARIRSTLQPTIALVLLQALRAIGVTSPFVWALVLRLGTLVLSFAVLLRVFAHVSPSLSRPARQTLWLSGLFLWFAPLFLGRFSSENLGGLALAAALTLVDGEGAGERRAGAGPRRDAVAGALLGVSLVFRFQMAFAAAAALAWLIARGRPGWARAARLALAAAAVVAAGTLVDAWFYQGWTFTPWAYFRTNVLEGVAKSFGTSPWYAYLLWPPLWMAPPLGLAVAFLAAVGVASRPRSPWSWVPIAFIAGHSVIPHKELRFLFPLLYLLPVLVARGVEAAARRPWAPGWRTATVWSLGVQNAIFLALLATPAIHRGGEFDTHYLRFLWTTAERYPGKTVYVLQNEGGPHLIYGLEANVYRHPRIRGVRHRAGDPLPTDVPPDTPPDRLLVLTRGTAPPVVAGAEATALAYAAEPGYRVMARLIGVEDAGWVRWLEDVDRWSTSDRARRVHRVRVAGAPEGGAP